MIEISFFLGLQVVLKSIFKARTFKKEKRMPRNQGFAKEEELSLSCDYS